MQAVCRDEAVSASAAKPRLVFIINPQGGSGHTLREWRRLAPIVVDVLGGFKVEEVQTSKPWDAADLARKAVKEGAETVVAVGGDGTLHEVVNGFFEDGKPIGDARGRKETALAVLPLGTGCDFARTMGWQKDGKAALARIANGRRQAIDVGRVQCRGANGQDRFFVNVADLGLSARAGLFAAQFKSWGPLCYSLATLRAFVGHRNRSLKMRADGQDWQTMPDLTMMAVGNAQYFGGGMRICPTANISDSRLDVVSLNGFRWWDFGLQGVKLFRGTHLTVKGVQSQSVRSLEVAELDGEDSTAGSQVLVQADGEVVGTLPATFSVVPSGIKMLV